MKEIRDKVRSVRWTRDELDSIRRAGRKLGMKRSEFIQAATRRMVSEILYGGSILGEEKPAGEDR